MTTFNMDNYNAITVLENKIAPSYFNAREKVIIDKYTLAAETVIGDEFLLPLVPENAIITEAVIFVPASQGTQGQLSMGLKAHVDRDGNTVAEDNDSLVKLADAGGQAVLSRSTLDSVGLFKVIGKGGAQPFVYVPEASDAADGEIFYAMVKYALPN